MRHVLDGKSLPFTILTLMKNTFRIHFFWMALACACLLLCAPNSQAATPSQAPSNKKSDLPAAPAQPTQPAVSSVSPVTQAAVQAGVLTCTSRVNQIATFLIGNNQSGAYLFFPQQPADQKIFSTSLEIQVPNGAAMYASASFAPIVNTGCGAVYDTVEYVKDTCANVEKTIFKGAIRGGVVKKDIVVMEIGSTKYFLMPAGSGCVLIKKEVVQ